MSKKRTTNLLGLALGLGLATGLATGANAAVFTEIGDASNSFGGGANPQAVGSGVTQINGSIGSNDQGDLFRITVDIGGTLTIQTSGSGGAFDTELFLFDATGAGIAANDDTGGLGLNSRIVVTIASGTYYIGIGDFNIVALDTDGTAWNTDAPPAAFGTLDFIGNVSAIGAGDYSVALSMTTTETSVPEPMALGLLAAGLLGIGGAARRRRTAQ